MGSFSKLRTKTVAMMAKLEADRCTGRTGNTATTRRYVLCPNRAYSVKANADAQYHKVKAAGFDAIIKKSGTFIGSRSGIQRQSKC